MAEVFLSYASEDRDKARELAEALAARGLSVWWDRQIPLGQAFDTVIERALAQANCLVVLWSARSVQSQWVRNEASDGEARGILVPVFTEAVRAPLAFRLLNGADLHDWQAGEPHPEFERLVERIKELLERRASGSAVAVASPSFQQPPPQQGSSARVTAANPSWPRAMVSVVALVLLTLAAGLYWWKDRSEPPLDSSTEQPAATPAPTAKRPAATERAIDGAAAGAGAAAAALVVQRDAEAGAGAAVGQITVVWHGANPVRWKVLDSRKKVLRDSANSGNTTRSEDLSPGDYVFALDYPEYPPVPVTVRAGQVSEVTPVIGQVIIYWTGDNRLRWKLLDSRKKVVRDAAVASQKSRTEDVLPGEYVVAADYPEYPTYPVTVRAGQAVELTPPVGQLTVNWNGANLMRWKLFDASKKVVRDTMVAAQRSRTEDMLPGEYAVVLDYSEYPPYPVSVREGQATAVAPAVGQIALAWTGTTRLGWKVLDAGKKVVRDTANSAKSTVTVDLLPGRYVVIFDYADFPPVPVTVTAGQVSKVAR